MTLYYMAGPKWKGRDKDDARVEGDWIEEASDWLLVNKRIRDKRVRPATRAERVKIQALVDERARRIAPYPRRSPVHVPGPGIHYMAGPQWRAQHDGDERREGDWIERAEQDYPHIDQALQQGTLRLATCDESRRIEAAAWAQKEWEERCALDGEVSKRAKARARALVLHAETSSWSNGEIARHAGCSVALVRKLRITEGVQGSGIRRHHHKSGKWVAIETAGLWGRKEKEN